MSGNPYSTGCGPPCAKDPGCSQHCSIPGCGPECVYNSDCVSAGYICRKEKCVEDPCDPNPCGVGANCALDASDGFTCKCPSGTIGDGRILCAQASDLLTLLKNSKINLDSSTSEEPSIGFKDCGKRLSEREDSLGFSNGQSVSTKQVILNHT